MDLKTTLFEVSLWTSTSPHFVDIKETGDIGAIGNAIEMPWPQLNPRSWEKYDAKPQKIALLEGKSFKITIDFFASTLIPPKIGHLMTPLKYLSLTDWYVH